MPAQQGAVCCLQRAASRCQAEEGHTVGSLGAGTVDEAPDSWPNGSLDAGALPAPLLLALKPDVQSSLAAGLLAALLSLSANASHSSCPPAHTQLPITPAFVRLNRQQPTMSAKSCLLP